MTTIDSGTATPSPGGVAGPVSGWLEPLVRVTALVVVAEALLLRGATRVFIHIPGLDVTSGALGWVTEVARMAFRMAVPLTFVLLIMLISSSWRAPSGKTTAIAGGGILAAMVTGHLEALRFGSNWLILGLMAVVALASAFRLESRARVPVAAWSAAFLMVGVVQLLDQQVADGAISVSLPWLGSLAEVVALLALLTAPLILSSRLNRMDWAIGIAVTTLLTIAMSGAEGQATARILLLWNLGWSGGYPVVVYAVAFGSLALTVAALLRQRRITAAASIIFLGAAGFGMFSSYQTALLLVGLLLIPTSTTITANQPKDETALSA